MDTNNTHSPVQHPQLPSPPVLYSSVPPGLSRNRDSINFRHKTATFPPAPPSPSLFASPLPRTQRTCAISALRQRQLAVRDTVATKSPAIKTLQPVLHRPGPPLCARKDCRPANTSTTRSSAVPTQTSTCITRLSDRTVRYKRSHISRRSKFLHCSFACHTYSDFTLAALN